MKLFKKKTYFQKSSCASKQKSKIKFINDCFGGILEFVNTPNIFFNILLLSKTVKHHIENELYNHCSNIDFKLSPYRDKFKFMKDKKYIIKLSILVKIIPENIEDFSFLQYCVNVKELKFSGLLFFDGTEIEEFNKNISLEKITVYDCSEFDMKNLLPFTKTLKDISVSFHSNGGKSDILPKFYKLESLSVKNNAMEIGALKSINLLRDIKKFSLIRCNSILGSNEKFDDVIKEWENLEEIEIVDWNIDRFNMSGLKNLKNLKNIHIHYFYLSSKKEFFFDFKMIMNSLGIEKIYLGGVSVKNVELLKNSKMLKTLTLHDSVSINDNILKYVNTELRELRLNYMKQMEGKNIERLAHLKELSILKSNFSNFEGLKKLGNLRKIKLDGVDVKDDVFEYFKKLELLELIRCQFVTEKGLSQLPKGLLNLKILTNHKLKSSFVQNFNEIESLHIKFCKNFIGFEIEKLKAIKKLILFDCEKLEDTHFQKLVFLEELVIENSPKITGKGFKQMKNLKILNLSKLPLVGDNSTNYFPKNLEFLYVFELKLFSGKNIKKFKKLKYLSFYGLKLGNIESFSVLRISMTTCDCSKFGYKKLKAIRELHLKNCTKLNVREMCKVLNLDDEDLDFVEEEQKRTGMVSCILRSVFE